MTGLQRYTSIPLDYLPRHYRTGTSPCLSHTYWLPERPPGHPDQACLESEVPAESSNPESSLEQPGNQAGHTQSYNFRLRDCQSRSHPHRCGHMSGSTPLLQAHNTMLLRPSTLRRHSEGPGLPHPALCCLYLWMYQGFCRSSYMYPKVFRPWLYPHPMEPEPQVAEPRHLQPVCMNSYPPIHPQDKSTDSDMSRPYDRSSHPYPGADPDQRPVRSYPA